MDFILMVYGSLRKGGEFHHYLKGADFIDTDCIKGYLMTKAGDYPVIHKSAFPEDTVFIEIYRIREYHLTEIDILEGYLGPGKNNEYERVYVQSCKGYKGYIYCSRDNIRADLKSRIWSGDWFNPDKKMQEG